MSKDKSICMYIYTYSNVYPSRAIKNALPRNKKENLFKKYY
jgi:hypothetical protein